MANRLTGERTVIGGKPTDVWVDDNGNLFVYGAGGGNKHIIGNIYRENEKQPFIPEDIGGESAEADVGFDMASGLNREDNLLTYLMDEEKAHDSINSLIQENEIKNADTPSSPGSRLGGPLATLGEMIAAKLIGQDPETGEIPTQPYPYNPLMNLLNLPPGNQMKTGGFSK